LKCARKNRFNLLFTIYVVIGNILSMKKLLLILLLSLSQVCFAVSSYVVLIPGAASSSGRIWIKGLSFFLGPIHQEEYFKHIKVELARSNFNVLVCPKNSDKDQRSLTDRALDCARYLRTFRGTFHIVGHSMGGLVARKLLDLPEVSSSIKSVTTISTPHGGTPLAGFALRHHENDTLMGKLLATFEFSPNKKAYIKDVTMLESGNSFISSLRNKASIPIYSISNYKVNFYNVAMEVTSRFLAAELREYYPNHSELNDGIVPTESAIFGYHLGTIEADHMESACILYSQQTAGCRKLLALLIPHLKWLTWGHLKR
jgi:pimeloyl-ACP methyl ester carboxylesterase